MGGSAKTKGTAAKTTWTASRINLTHGGSSPFGPLIWRLALRGHTSNTATLARYFKRFLRMRQSSTGMHERFRTSTSDMLTLLYQGCPTIRLHTRMYILFRIFQLLLANTDQICTLYMRRETTKENANYTRNKGSIDVAPKMTLQLVHRHSLLMRLLPSLQARGFRLSCRYSPDAYIGRLYIT